MTEFFQNLFDFYKERIESPFLFTFMLAWLVVNKGFVYIVIFYSESDKYQTISNYQFQTWDAYCLPLIITSAYIIIAPIINNGLQLIKYSILNIFQGMLQLKKSANLDAMHLKEIEIQKQKLEEQKKIFSEEKLEHAEEMTKISNDYEDIRLHLNNLMRTNEKMTKLIKYKDTLVSAFNIRLNAGVAQAKNTKVTNCCIILFFDEIKGKDIEPVWINDVVQRFDMSYNDYMNLYKHGELSSSYEFRNSKGELFKLRIKEIHSIRNGATADIQIPFDLKEGDVAII